ncbi:MAG: hypothetical protein JRI67_07610 [Deltaproteobacteria bacterium]|nr:hypothetical protein [Deltaproteobacteria bacterium]
MSYLQRRVTFLFDQFENKKISFAEEFYQTGSGKQLIGDLKKLRRLPDGTVDLSTCTELVRSIAKALYLLKSMPGQDKAKSENRTQRITPESISLSMKEYFQMLEDFFLDVTGTSVNKFVVNETFGERVRRDAEKIAKKSYSAYQNYIPKIGKFHGDNSPTLLGASKAIGGIKCVLGGSSRFPEVAFDGLRKFALYADTIFVPDPILPWIEASRDEEKFAHVHLLEQMYNLLKLKPLIDAELPCPAIIVFPSWEKSLEASDIETQDGISEIILTFFSFYLDASFSDESEIVEYISGPGKNEFRNAVDKHNLFWPPEANAPLPFVQALANYKEQLKIWRSAAWLKQFNTLPSELMVFNGILERLSPQFHINDNAQTLKAQPLFWLPQHFHYFQLLSQGNNTKLQQTGLLKAETFVALQSLLSPNLAWLGNIPINELARLREENCNEEFRKRLASYIDELSVEKIDEIDKASLEVARGVSALLVEHEKKARQIAGQYEKKHVATLGMSILTIGAVLCPWLAPYLGASISVAPIAKYSVDVINRAMDYKRLARSFTGILSYAKSTN